MSTSPLPRARDRLVTIAADAADRRAELLFEPSCRMAAACRSHHWRDYEDRHHSPGPALPGMRLRHTMHDDDDEGTPSPAGTTIAFTRSGRS
jgi:hypothetical protein